MDNDIINKLNKIIEQKDSDNKVLNNLLKKLHQDNIDEIHYKNKRSPELTEKDDTINKDNK